jgi:Fe-S-cluster containining protein
MKQSSKAWLNDKERSDSIVRLCSVEGCTRKHYAKGYCEKHYRQSRYKPVNEIPVLAKILKNFRREENLENKCKMCGMCCRAIRLPVDWEYFIDRYPEPITEDREGCVTKYTDLEFIRTFWQPISKEKALEINPHLKTWPTFEDGFYYKCTKFDEKTNKCTVNEDKPRVCYGFPFYDHTPTQNDVKYLYSEDCGFKDSLLPEIGTCSHCKAEDVELEIGTDLCCSCFNVLKNTKCPRKAVREQHEI